MCFVSRAAGSLVLLPQRGRLVRGLFRVESLRRLVGEALVGGENRQKYRRGIQAVEMSLLLREESGFGVGRIRRRVVGEGEVEANECRRASAETP